MLTTQTQKEMDAVLHYTERVGTTSPENNPIKRAMDMLLHAEATWPVVAREEGGLKQAFLPYIVVVGFIPGLFGSVLNAVLWGSMGTMFGATQSVSRMTSMIFGSAIHLALGMLGILASAKIVELVVPSFGLRKSWVLSTRAFVYGSTPVYVVGVISWVPILGWLVGFVAIFWSLLLTFRGLKALLAIPSAPNNAAAVEKPKIREGELAGV